MDNGPRLPGTDQRYVGPGCPPSGHVHGARSSHGVPAEEFVVLAHLNAGASSYLYPIGVERWLRNYLLHAPKLYDGDGMMKAVLTV